MRSTVLGAGSWGTALASVLAAKGHAVTLWGRDAAVVDAVSGRHENPRYLPGIALPESLGPTTDLGRALPGAGIVVLGVPSHAMREVLTEARPFLEVGSAIVSVAKGIEGDTLMTMNDLGAAYVESGQLQLAIPWLVQAVKLRQEKLGLDHTNTIDSMNYLGKAYMLSGTNWYSFFSNEILKILLFNMVKLIRLE